MVDYLEGYYIVSTNIVTVKNDLGLTQDFEVTLYRNKECNEITTVDPYIEMPCKLPSDIFPPNNYKVTNG